jgi:hypothetical protein
VHVHRQIFECHGSYYYPGYLERYNVQADRSIIGFSLYFAVAFVDSWRANAFQRVRCLLPNPTFAKASSATTLAATGVGQPLM